MMNPKTKQALFASGIATILAIPLTYITLYTIMVLTGITIPFTFGLIAYGLMNAVSIYTICTADDSSHSRFSWGSRDHVYYSNSTSSESTSIMILVLFAIIAIIAIGTLNGHIALGLVSWWQPALPLIINAQAPLLVATLKHEQINEEQPECKVCLCPIEHAQDGSYTFYLPDSAKFGSNKMATHSLLCASCYSRYDDKDRDLVLQPAGIWNPYQLKTSP